MQIDQHITGVFIIFFTKAVNFLNYLFFVQILAVLGGETPPG